MTALYHAFLFSEYWVGVGWRGRTLSTYSANTDSNAVLTFKEHPVWWRRQKQICHRIV